MRKAFIVLISMAFIIHAQAQMMQIRHLDQATGIPSTSILSTICDADGFTWIGSMGGLTRYDGRNLISYDQLQGLRFNAVYHVFEEKPHQFLICNYQSLLNFDGKHFREQKTNLPEGTEFKHVQQLSNGEVWLSTMSGMFQRKEPGHFIRRQFDNLSSKDIESIYEIRKNAFYAYSIERRKMYLISMNQLIDSLNNPEGEVLYDAFYVNGTWHFAFSRGMRCFSNSGWIKVNPPPGMRAEHLSSCFRDRRGWYWYTDQHFNIWCQTPDSISCLSRSYQLQPAMVPKWTENREGQVMLSYINGVYFFQPNPCIFQPIQKLSMVNLVQTASFMGTDSILLSCNQQGLQILHKGRLLSISLKKMVEPLDTLTRHASFQSDNNPQTGVLHVVKKGLYRYQNRECTWFNPAFRKLDSISLNWLYDDKRNLCYMALPGRLLRVSPHRIDTLDTGFRGYGSYWRNICCSPDGSIYAVMGQQQIYRFQGNRLIRMNQTLGLPVQELSLSIQGNYLMIALQGTALYTYRWEKGNWVKHQRIGREQGLPDTHIRQLLLDHQENIWINAYTGVYQFNRQPDNYGLHPALAPPLLNQQGVKHIPDWIGLQNNHIYTLGKGGLWKIPILTEISHPIYSRPYLTPIRANGIWLDTLINKGQVSHKNKEWLFPAGTNSLQVEIGSVYYGFDEALRFAYRLLPEQNNWQWLDKQSSVNFAQLQPGTYTLEYQVSHPSVHKTNSPTAWVFTIKPYFYQTRLFKILAVGLLGICLFMLIRWRDKRKNQQIQQELHMATLRLEALQSQMNPHFLFNALNSIQSYILNHQAVDAARYLARFAKLIRTILDQSHHLEVPLLEIMETLTMYLDLEAFRFNQEFSYKVTLEDPHDLAQDIVLPPMLLQPFAENAILHGLMPKKGNKQLEIKIRIRTNDLLIIIEDNGVGRKESEQAKSHTSRGQKLVEGMFESLDQLKFTRPTLTFTDKKHGDGTAAGTRVEILFTIPHP